MAAPAQLGILVTGVTQTAGTVGSVGAPAVTVAPGPYDAIPGTTVSRFGNDRDRLAELGCNMRRSPAAYVQRHAYAADDRSPIVPDSDDHVRLGQTAAASGRHVTRAIMCDGPSGLCELDGLCRQERVT